VGQAIGIWSSAAALDELGQLSAPLYALASTKLGELADPLRELVTSPWPAVEIMERTEHPASTYVSVTRALSEFVRAEIREPIASAPGYMFRVFPHREIASDLIRLQRMPFCGMRPFMKLVTNVAYAKLPSLSMIEGGPHLGDCTCWAAAALRGSSTQLKAIGIEAMADAAAHFKETVRINNFERVQVIPRALDEKPNMAADFRYEEGRNGQATPAELYQQCEGCIPVQGVRTTSIDAEWEGPLDVLKLSVNGAELKTLRGARQLLTKRRVCMVLMHATKLELGAQNNPDFAPGLFDVLNENGMEILHHKDKEEKGDSSTDTITSRGKMQAIFTKEGGVLEAQDYIFARQPSADCERVNAYLPI